MVPHSVFRVSVDLSRHAVNGTANGSLERPPFWVVGYVQAPSHRRAALGDDYEGMNGTPHAQSKW
jgi:hypothetical protein